MCCLSVPVSYMSDCCSLCLIAILELKPPVLHLCPALAKDAVRRAGQCMGPRAPPMAALQPAMPLVSQAPLQLATPFAAFSSSAPDVRKKKKRTTSSSSSSSASSMSTKELRRKLRRKEKNSRKHQSPAPHHKHHRKHAARKHRGRTSSPRRRSASHHAKGRKRSGQVSASRSKARPNSRKHHAQASYREHRHSSHQAQGRQRSGQVSPSRSRARPTSNGRRTSRHHSRVRMPLTACSPREPRPSSCQQQLRASSLKPAASQPQSPPSPCSLGPNTRTRRHPTSATCTLRPCHPLPYISGASTPSTTACTLDSLQHCRV